MNKLFSVLPLMLGLGCTTRVILGVDSATSSSGGTTGGAVTVTTIAGGGPTYDPSAPSLPAGYADGTGGPNGTARFNWPSGVAIDPEGNIFVADYGNMRIRKIDPDGDVTTVAGNGTMGSADGIGGSSGAAEFSYPSGVTLSSSGDLYVADTFSNLVRKIDPGGNVTTVAAGGIFNLPHGIASDAAGNIYVGDTESNRILEIDSTGTVKTLAGVKYDFGFQDGSGGPSGAAQFYNPTGVAVDAASNVYVADSANNRIRKIDSSGNVTTVAGNGTPPDEKAPPTYADGTGGPNGTAELDFPCSVAALPDGTLYVADTGNNRIRMIDRSGNVTTIAGNGTEGLADGTGGPNGSASFNEPKGIAIDAAGNLIVADTLNNRIREITF